MISIIIPVLNEAEGIRDCLKPLLIHGDRLEIIVVDGDSTDGTPDIVKQYPSVKLVPSPKGRAQQMNHGAAIATGDILLFLHSDTKLPSGFITAIESALTTPDVVAGAFQLKIDDPQPSLRWIEKTVFWRSQYLSLPYGDQGIFIKTSIFQTLGGYADLPIMEDYEFARRLKKQGSIVLLPTAVTTSARRWQQLGVWRTTLINQAIIIGFNLGLDPNTLRGWYRHQTRH